MLPTLFQRISQLPGLNKFNIDLPLIFVYVKWFVHTFVYAKSCVHIMVTVDTNLHHLIYNLLIAIVFSLHILLSVKDVLNTKSLVTLTEYQQVGWRLIKLENYNNKNYQRHTQPNLTLLFNEIYSFTSNTDSEQPLNNCLKSRSKVLHHTVKSNTEKQYTGTGIQFDYKKYYKMLHG